MPTKNTAKPRFEELGLDAWYKDPKRFRSEFPRREGELEQRMKYRPKFQELRKRKDFDQIIHLMRTYVWECLPAPKMLEAEWWCVTALPSTNADRLSVCNIRIMELFVLGFHPENSKDTWAFLNVDKLKLLNSFNTQKAFLAKYPRTTLREVNYRPNMDAGIENIAIYVNTNALNEFELLLEDAAILDAARSLNWNVLHLGRNTYRTFHCYDLADLILD